MGLKRLCMLYYLIPTSVKHYIYYKTDMCEIMGFSPGDVLACNIEFWGTNVNYLD